MIKTGAPAIHTRRILGIGWASGAVVCLLMFSRLCPSIRLFSLGSCSRSRTRDCARHFICLVVLLYLRRCMAVRELQCGGRERIGFLGRRGGGSTSPSSSSGGLTLHMRQRDSRNDGLGGLSKLAPSRSTGLHVAVWGRHSIDEIVDGSAGTYRRGEAEGLVGRQRQASTKESEGGRLYGSRGRCMESSRLRVDCDALWSNMGSRIVAVDRRRTGDALEMRVQVQLFCAESKSSTRSGRIRGVERKEGELKNGK